MRESPLARVWLALLIPVVVIFGPALFTSRSFGVRDAGHYYGPLWRHVNTQWQHGFPLWNALEENGRPLAADATASVFYPPKLVFALPFGFDFAMELFVVGHIILAMAGTYGTARSFRLSREAAGLAALSYALSGTVVFLHCNPIFLVGAAWLPIGIGVIQRLLTPGQTGYWRSVTTLGAILAMMILGGDPQMAYLLLLVALLRIVVSSRPASTGRLQPLIGPAVAALIAISLAAIQIFPTYQWARQSDRATYHEPRSLTELAGEVALGRSVESSGLIDIPQDGSHRAAIYQFSVGPWRWFELFWPNFGGRPFPNNQRWINAIPAEGRYWTPTLYMGLLPLLLALSAFRRNSWSQPLRRWLMVCTVFFGLASLGYYGVAWLVDEVRWARGDFPADDWGPVGGLYWLMTIVLPGFVTFRFPAKLWTVVAISLSLLAALQADQSVGCDARRLRRVLAGYLLLTLIPLLGAVYTAFHPDWIAFPSDSIYGPLDVEGAVVGVIVAMFHGIVVSGAIWWSARRQDRIGRGFVPLIVLLTAIDLTIAHSWLVPTVPGIAGRSPAPPWIESIEPMNDPPPRYFRWTVDSWYPREWSLQSDRDRLSQVVDWDRRTLRPKYNLDRSTSAVQSYTSFSSAAHRATLELLYKHSQDRSHHYYHLVDVLGIQYVVSPADVIHLRHLSFHSVIETPGGAHVWRNQGAYPRAWIVHESQHKATPTSGRWKDLQGYIQTVLVEPGESLRQRVTLDADVGHLAKQASTSRRRHVASNEIVETCRILSQRGGEMVLEARLNEAGFVVISDSYAPGWQCHVESESGARLMTDVLRANGIMRAVALPQGQYRLTLQYRPRSFVIGAWISVVSWCGWLVTFWIGRPRSL